VIALLRGGLELAYVESGRGIPVLMVHGFPHNRTVWEGQINGLSNHAHFVAPDLRGCGGSTVDGPFSMDQYADDLATFLDSLELDRVVLCGLSMGGYIAFAMLRRHRARVRALVLADTRATPDTVEARANRMRLIALIEEQGVDALAERQLQPSLGRSTFEQRPQLTERVRRMLASAPAAGAVGALRAMAERPDSSPLLPTIDVPTMVVGGLEDELTPPAELRALAEAIPRSRLELLERCGHLSPMERPAAFNHVLGEFLGTLLYD